MKNFKQIILPAVIVLMGTGAAFATNQAKKNQKNVMNEDGYIYNHTLNQCEVAATCSTEIGDVCTVNNKDNQPQVFGLDNEGSLSTCTIELYQPKN